MRNNQITEEYYTTIQMRIPVDIEKIIEITEPVYTFNEVMIHIDPKILCRCGIDRIKELREGV